MRITTHTLTAWARALAVALVSLSIGALTACDRSASAAVSGVSEQASATAVVAVLTGRIVGVTDGDTLTLLDAQNQQHTIRLAEIDAPERAQPWGARSRQTLSALAFGKAVLVQKTDTDRYGRIVGRVFAGGEDVNQAMVERGAAWAYRQYLTDETLLAVEARARAARAGLWSMSDAQTVAPWEWRRGVRVGGNGPVVSAQTPVPQSLFGPDQKPPGRGTSDQFSCSGKRYCRQMTSCAEAQFYLRQCEVPSLDGNGDGEPCETLCATVFR